MRLGAAHTVIRVGDIAFWCNLSWGRLKAIMREMSVVGEDPQAQLEFLGSVMAEVVVRADGLETDDGPVQKLTPELVEQLPADMVGRFFEQLFRAGNLLAAGEGPDHPLAGNGQPSGS